jgi:hypothetical protein
MTTLFQNESEGYSGLGALVGCALALVMFLATAGVMYREFTQPTFTDHQLAQLKQDCELTQC